MTGPAVQSATRAVFFDVDFTLIYPGPAFQGGGYRDFCARHGVDVDPDAFDRAVAAASTALDPRGDVYDYDAQIYIDYTRRIIEGMGGTGPRVEAAARDIYAEWAACHHFTMYDDVPGVLRTLHAVGPEDRVDLELASLPRLVPDPLRARGALLGRRSPRTSTAT